MGKCKTKYKSESKKIITKSDKLQSSHNISNVTSPIPQPSEKLKKISRFWDTMSLIRPPSGASVRTFRTAPQMHWETRLRRKTVISLLQKGVNYSLLAWLLFNITNAWTWKRKGNVSKQVTRFKFRTQVTIGCFWWPCNHVTPTTIAVLWKKGRDWLSDALGQGHFKGSLLLQVENNTISC